jgi:hypothetical protein
VLAGLGRVPGLRLVAVEAVDAARAQRGLERFGQVLGQRRVTAFAPGDGETAGDAVAVAALQALGQGAAVAGVDGFLAVAAGQRAGRGGRGDEIARGRVDQGGHGGDGRGGVSLYATAISVCETVPCRIDAGAAPAGPAAAEIPR